MSRPVKARPPPSARCPPRRRRDGRGSRPVPDLPGTASRRCWGTVAAEAGDGPDTGACPGSGRPAAAGRRARVPAGRRAFRITGSVAVGIAGAGALIGQRLAGPSSAVVRARTTVRIPPPAQPAPPLPAGADLQIPGLSSFITPNRTFYRVDTAIVLPEIAPAAWQLQIHGMVASEITLTFDDLLQRPLIEDYITLTCVSNPVGGPYIGNARWLGASLAQPAAPGGDPGRRRPAAVHVRRRLHLRHAGAGRDGRPGRAAGGGHERRRALPVRTAFPSAWSCRACTGTSRPASGSPTSRSPPTRRARPTGPSAAGRQQAPIKTESRIDVPSGNQSLRPGARQVAGVAWAQHKGIDAVEVRVDKGPWHQARLAGVPGIDTWRQWVWDWQATPGTHLIEVARHRRHRLHPDRAPGPAGAQRRDRVPAAHGAGRQLTGALEPSEQLVADACRTCTRRATGPSRRRTCSRSCASRASGRASPSAGRSQVTCPPRGRRCRPSRRAGPAVHHQHRAGDLQPCATAGAAPPPAAARTACRAVRPAAARRGHRRAAPSSGLARMSASTGWLPRRAWHQSARRGTGRVRRNHHRAHGVGRAQVRDGGVQQAKRCRTGWRRAPAPRFTPAHRAQVGRVEVEPTVEWAPRSWGTNESPGQCTYTTARAPVVTAAPAPPVSMVPATSKRTASS